MAPVIAGICGLVFLAASPTHGQDAAALKAESPPANAIWLDSLEIGKMSVGYGSPHAGKSVDNNALKLKGATFSHGIGTHAVSQFNIDLKGVATRFVALAGVDDETNGQGSVIFQVWVDGKQKAESSVLHGGDEPKLFSVDLTGAKLLTLYASDADDGIDSDHADWGGAMLQIAAGASASPVALAADAVKIPGLTLGVVPPRYVPVHTPRIPAIHGARIYGSTPGRPFLFLVSATGEGPLAFSAQHLPAGLMLDPRTGIITGSLKSAGTTDVDLMVKGPAGKTHRKLTIVGGEHKLALTPPMGWNSWNVWAGEVDQDKTKAAADAMIKSGLAAHGFQYVNVDDTWEAGRDAEGNIETNKKFPDMKAMCDYVHGLGLKVGIYSSPGPKTCGGYEASYQHEQKDADSYAKWGFDYLKHDWCSYEGVATGEGLERLQKPYRMMQEALNKTNRDILYSLCQYGMGNVWEWGSQVGGNCYRTTGDINDSWGSLHGIYESQNGHEKFAGPGHWNDPDMLVVGLVGWGSPHPSHLKPNEQILHISMWCLLSSPLLIGCDMTKMDAFTTDLLSNDEALEINQDPLGKPAGRVAMDGTKEVWARPLFDGTMAVGLVNSGNQAQKITAKWSDLGVSGSQPVRDLWMHKNVGASDGQYAVEVPAHGAVLLKIGKSNSKD